MDKKMDAFKKQMEELKNGIEGKIQDLLENSEELARFINFRRQYFHSYSINNTLLIYRQMPEATYVAGFHRWIELGYKVKKGSKGISILIPLIRKIQDEKENKEKSMIYGFKKATVFDASQVEAQENAVPFPKVNISLGESKDILYDPELLYEKTKQIISQYGEVQEEESLGRAVGRTDGKTMWIRKSDNKIDMAGTLVHEFIHLLNHFGEDRKKLTKNEVETEAELGVIIYGSYFNLDISGQYNYLTMYRKDRDLHKCFEKALKAFEELLYGKDSREGLETVLKANKTIVEPLHLKPMEAAYLMLFSIRWVFNKEYGIEDRENEDEWVGIDSEDIDKPLFEGKYYKNWAIYDPDEIEIAKESLEEAKDKDLKYECFKHISKSEEYQEIYKAYKARINRYINQKEKAL